MKPLHSLIILPAIALLFTGCAPWSVQTRSVPANGPAAAPGDSAYIESNGINGPKYGCSFIEFDGKGGFLDFQQLVHAKSVLLQRAASSNVLLVLYCHGWNNNAQSDDVLQFLGFLRRLSLADTVRKNGLSVQGVYLGWRGSQYVPILAHSQQVADVSLYNDFDKHVLNDPKYSVPPFPGNLLYPLEFGSYWSIKARAEFHISRIELARAIFDLAFTLKSPAEAAKGRDHRVFMIGHSFGALVVEQTLGQASVGLLTSQWDSGNRQDRWPFDLVVLLNSAAPSLYAKQLKDFLADDRNSTRKPRIVSITSTGDWATGELHKLGNLGDRYFAPDLQRKYHPYGSTQKSLTAGYYYDFTPGHNPYLINGCIYLDKSVPPPAGLTPAGVFPYNLAHAGATGTFYAQSVHDGKVYGFRLWPNADDIPSNYWILTVPTDIIPWHTEIWSDSSMEMLAGIYSMVEAIPPVPKQFPHMKQD